MDSYRRGLRDGALVNLKLFLLEKVKLGQTWLKLVLFGTGRYNMLIVAKSMSEVDRLKILSSREFDMKDLGAAKKILGMKIRRERATKILWLS